MNGSSFFRPNAALDAMTGRVILGGCEDCHAEQTLSEAEPGVYVLVIHHDATCPTYRAIVARRDRGEQ